MVDAGRLALLWAVFTGPLLAQSVDAVDPHGELVGHYRLRIESPGGSLPVQLELSTADRKLCGSLINGTERIAIPQVIVGETLQLRLPHYDSEIVLSGTAESGFVGHWTKQRGRGKPTHMKVQVERQKHRIDEATSPAAIPEVDEPARRRAFTGRFAVRFASSPDPAVAIFERSEGAVEAPMHGTFLTTLGDYRFLAGDLVGEELWLSCFDGAHAFLFRARAAASGELQGDFWSSDNWHETWTAKRDDTAALPDGFALSAAREGADLRSVKVRDLMGNERLLDDPAWRGRPRVVELFGSWCPNCHDHGAYLAELHRRYADHGLVVFGIAFEHDDDLARSARQVATFRDRHHIDYPLFLAGLSDKAKATVSLGVLDKVRAFPTTLFLDGEGRIRKVYQGWTGPAAAADHARLRERFESVIEELLRDR